MKKILFSAVLILLFCGQSGSVMAAACPAGTKEGTICLDNPLANKATDATVIIGTIIKGALGVLGSLALLMMVWGGFQWLTSAGNTEKVEKGTSTMLWAIIGVVVVLSSYMLVDVLTRVLSTGQ